MKSLMLVLRAILFLLLGITLWFAGTLFHVSLWWTLGVPTIPPILPFANLAIVPLCFWLSWQLTLNPAGLACVHCRDPQGSIRAPVSEKGTGSPHPRGSGAPWRATRSSSQRS